MRNEKFNIGNKMEKAVEFSPNLAINSKFSFILL